MKIRILCSWAVGGLLSCLAWGAADVVPPASVGQAPAASPAAPATPVDPYTQEIETWRTQRVQQLTRADGWLTLIGLHFLKPGENSVGSAADNAIVLAKGPADLGTIILAPNGMTRGVLNPGIEVQVNGQPALSADLRDDSRSKPTLVSVDTVSLFVINRDGKKALRVKDSAAELRTHFLGIDYFPIDPSWRIEAQWVPFEKPREVPIKNILGNVSPALVLGKAVFTRDGHSYELLPIQDDPDGLLFFVISDLTSGDQTYAAARFLYAASPIDGKVILDFNKAQNPPCAFTAFATCPLPPKENQLPIAVTAGEKKYRGHGVSP